MAKYLLINALAVGGIGLLYPGTVYDDQYDDITRFTNAGAVLWPFADATVKAASDTVLAAKSSGMTHEQAQARMLAALATSASTKADAATVASAAAPSKVTVTIGFADFAALGAGVKTYDVALGAALPAGANLLGPPKLTGWTGFDDAAHGTYVLIVGTSAGGNQVATSQSVAAGQTGFPKIMTAGAAGFAGAAQGSSSLSVRITSSVDLNTATAGAVTVTVYYFVLA